MSYLVPYGKKDKGLDFMRRFFNEDLWDGFFSGSMPGFTIGGIRADIREKENEYIVEAEIPGFTKEQIEIQYENNTLTIIARQQNERNEEKDQYLRRERHYGELRRSFYLENVMEDYIGAQYRDGVLHIILPKDKNKETKRKRIDIQ